MRTLLAVLLVALAQPLNAQPIPAGDEVRVREAKGAPWASGIFAGSDSTGIALTQDGIERTYELLRLERVEWKAPRNLPFELLLGTAGGAVVGLVVEAFSLILTSSCYDVLVDTGECNEDWGKAAGIGAAAGAGMVILSYAGWPREWKNVTKQYPPAGGTH